MLPILAGDIPWAAGGLMRCFDIVADEGTIINATFPAAVGKGPFGPAWGAGNLVAEVMSRMLDSAPPHRGQVQSVCNGTTDLCVVSGLDHRHESTKGFVTPIFDVMAGGYGAQVSHDGVDTGGRLIIPAVRAPDAEMTEYLYPLVALWRREEMDSGGPGRQRGGMSGSVCYVPHPDQEGQFGLVVTGNGKVANQNVGLAGGYPGNSQLDMVIRGISKPKLNDALSIPADLTELGGVRDVLPVHGESTWNDTDALFMHWQAGGGYGDPILREPELVAEDVQEFRVSPEAAAGIYGVVITEDHRSFDRDRTEAARMAIRAARARKAGLPDAVIESQSAHSVDPVFRRARRQHGGQRQRALPASLLRTLRNTNRSHEGREIRAPAARGRRRSRCSRAASLAQPAGLRRRRDRLPAVALPRVLYGGLLAGGPTEPPAAGRLLRPAPITGQTPRITQAVLGSAAGGLQDSRPRESVTNPEHIRDQYVGTACG